MSRVFGGGGGARDRFHGCADVLNDIHGLVGMVWHGMVGQPDPHQGSARRHRSAIVISSISVKLTCVGRYV